MRSSGQRQYALAPIQAPSYQSGVSAFPSPVDTASTRSCGTSSVSDAGTFSSGDEEKRRSTSTIRGKQYRTSRSPQSGREDEYDPFAQRHSLLPNGKPVIPPGVDYGGHRREIKQKQNCGRRATQQVMEDYETADELKKRQFHKKNDHTKAERTRRNDHKNLLMDIYMMTPMHYLINTGYTDHNKDPTKQEVLSANVSYQVDLATRCTEQHHEISTLTSSIADKDKVLAQQNQEIQDLRRRFHDQERRTSISSIMTEVPMSSLRRLSICKAEPVLAEPSHTHSIMEPRVISGPPTPALSASGRSSPSSRSRPVSRTGSPVRALLAPLTTGSDFGFPVPYQPKRKPQECWTAVSIHNNHDLSHLSPKRRCK